jgi:hypothetical protein
MTRKLLVAAPPRLRAQLAAQFAADGDAVVALDDSAAAGDAAILDAAHCDAGARARALRDAGFAGTIVVIGAPAAAADFSLPRPFRFADLRAVLAAAPAPSAAGARLTEKEAAILDRLTRAEGATIDKGALLREIWGYGPNVSTRTLETHIHRLRRKIEADPARPARLLTAEGGYRLAPVDAARPVS